VGFSFHFVSSFPSLSLFSCALLLSLLPLSFFNLVLLFFCSFALLDYFCIGITQTIKGVTLCVVGMVSSDKFNVLPFFLKAFSSRVHWLLDDLDFFFLLRFLSQRCFSAFVWRGYGLGPSSLF